MVAVNGMGRVKLPAIPILSDLDGTLIDSTASVVAAFRWWAEARGLPADIIHRIPFGRTAADTAAVLAPELSCVEEGALLDERQTQNTAGVVALEGAHELLSTHSNLAIVTSCPHRLAHARLLAAGLPEPRHLVTPECWSRGKPDPEPYLRGAEVLGARPEECIVLEDTPSGIASGVRAGMRVIAVITTHAPEQLADATARIDSLVELPAALDYLGVR